MRCHYDVLEIERTADDVTIKKAYRQLALKWHPDKNPTNVEECTRYFALIQQAYEVLIDPHERSWYDRHRESILKGGIDEHYEDNSLNLFPYFTSTCYSGYDNSDKGFYAVYRQVFATLACEDYDFLDGKVQAYPEFGYADSAFEDVVGPFYAFWGSFCTARTFVWVDKYNIMNASNRRIARAMEKENKKLREASKRERNEEIRELVAFLRKRDPRVTAYKKLLDERRLEQERKTEENRKQRILERLSQVGEYKESEEIRQSQLENLREIEEALDAEFGISDDENESNYNDGSDVYCIFCEKSFKTKKALANHENSKKHKDMVTFLKKHIQEDDVRLLITDERLDKNEEAEELQLNESNKKKSKRKKRREQKIAGFDTNDDDGDRMEAGSSEDRTNVLLARKDTEEICENVTGEAKTREANIFLSNELHTTKARRKKEKQTINECNKSESAAPKTGSCNRCGEFFESRTKLFAHLKESGHATLKAPPIRASAKAKVNRNAKK